MRFRFEDGELDVDRVELRVHGEVVPVDGTVASNGALHASAVASLSQSP